VTNPLADYVSSNNERGLLEEKLLQQTEQSTVDSKMSTNTKEQITKTFSYLHFWFNASLLQGTAS
jgi:hypothetical protein